MNLISDFDICLADFGVSVTIKETAKADKPVTLIFDQAGYVEMGMITDKPQITAKATDLAGVDIKNATIVINTTEYRMIKPLPDDAGLITAGLARI